MSDRGGQRELVDEGKTGWIIDFEDDKQRSRLVEKIVDGDIDLDSIRGNCLQKSTEFSKDFVARELEKIFSMTLRCK